MDEAQTCTRRCLWNRVTQFASARTTSTWTDEKLDRRGETTLKTTTSAVHEPLRAGGAGVTCPTKWARRFPERSGDLPDT